MIITRKMIQTAIGLSRPSAELILASADSTWGPKWIEGLVHPTEGLGTELISFTFGERIHWNPDWGTERDFVGTAKQKVLLAHRLGMNTSKIAATTTWLIREGEFLYPGGVSESGISVGVSGAKGWADEAIAKIVVVNIIMLAMLEVDLRKEAKRMQV